MRGKELFLQRLGRAGAIIAAAAYLTITMSLAGATKAPSGPLNFSILFSPFQYGVKPTYCPGDSVSYKMTVENPNATADHSIVFKTTFPEEVTCSTVAPTSGCSLSSNRLTCSIGTLKPNQRVAFTVNCQVKTTAVLGSKARAWASVTSANSSSSNQGYLEFLVNCPTPPATPTAACTPTPVAPTPHPVCTDTPVPPTPAPVCEDTPTPTPTPTWTSTPTPDCTDTPVPPTPTPVCTETPVPPTPTVCQDTPKADESACETYSIERKVYERWSRHRVRPVAIREDVYVLPAGKDLACLEEALQSKSVGCLSYNQFGSCSDPFLRRHLAREGSSYRCFGVSNMTQWLLSQACDQDRSSTECSQFLALNTYQSNDYPLGSETTGVELCGDHNPRSQLFIIDAQCRLVLNPTDDQKNDSCPGAIIRGHSFSQGAHRRQRRW